MGEMESPAKVAKPSIIKSSSADNSSLFGSDKYSKDDLQLADKKDTDLQSTAISPSPSSNNGSSATTNKCAKCQKRMAREACTQGACLTCCDDLEGCEVHKKPRAQALLKEQILAGTTETQKLAAARRRMRIPDSGRFFKEPGFVYQGDTVVIWDVRAYARNPKWREDAVRKSVRRQRALVLKDHYRPLRNSRKRFRRIAEMWYEEALNLPEAKANPLQPTAQTSASASQAKPACTLEPTAKHPHRQDKSCQSYAELQSGASAQCQESSFISQQPESPAHSPANEKSSCEVH